jgi:hypothetical protein
VPSSRKLWTALLALDGYPALLTSGRAEGLVGWRRAAFAVW